MKKSVFIINEYGTKTHIEIEVLLDINRELTDNDNMALHEHIGNLEKSLKAETKRLDPVTEIESDTNRLEILGLFIGRSIFVDEIPNEYCSEYCCKHLPWFIVTTNKGRIKIGKRKRVINIDWSDSIIKEQASELFPDEDVTKYDRGIHAWSLEKAQEYIDKLLG